MAFALTHNKLNVIRLGRYSLSKVKIDIYDVKNRLPFDRRFLNLGFIQNKSYAFFSASMLAIASSTPSIESAAFLIRSKASTKISSAVA